MTRREREILIASVSWTDKTLTVNEEKAFQAGARWADKTMIEKTYEWIISNMPKYVKANRLDVFINNEDMANDFKRAMEE